jgi:hypothetical protein
MNLEMCIMVMKQVCIFRVLPSKTLTVRGNKCTGGNLSKERLTLFICANMAGEIEKPIVTGKSVCPRPFRHLDRNSLPVNWRSNKKSLDDQCYNGRVDSFF